MNHRARERRRDLVEGARARLERSRADRACLDLDAVARILLFGRDPANDRAGRRADDATLEAEAERAMEGLRGVAEKKG